MKAKPYCIAAASALMLGSCQLASPVPNRPGYEQYGITELSGAIDLSAEVREESRNSANGDLDLSETRFREQLQLALAGFYYHPKLIEFDLDALVGLEQRDLESTGELESNTVDGQNLGYNFSIRIFKDNPYTAEFFTRRTETLMRQNFFATGESTVEEVGMFASAREWWIPSRLKVSHYNSEGRGLNTFSLARDTIRLDGIRDEDRTQYRYLTELNHVDLAASAAPLDDFSLTTSLRKYFGGEKQHLWNNRVNLRSQKGISDNSNLTASSDYQHQWTENFNSLHDFSYSTYSRDGEKTDTVTIGSGVSHQLFASLTSGAGASWSSSSFGGGSIDTYGARGSLSYTKETSFGKLGLSQSVSTQIRKRGSIQGFATIFEESFVFESGVPMYLANVAVDSLTIVVRDSSGLITYTRNADYFVVQVGSRTRIDIPVTSLISVGDEILVDYDFEPTPEQEIQTTASVSRFSLAMGQKASFSLSRSVSRQSLNVGVDDGTLDDSTRTYASLSYYPWSITTFGADFEDLESGISPYQRVSASVEQGLPLFDGLDWSAWARTYHVTFGDDPRSEQGASASTRIVASISRTMSAGLTAEYHKAKYRTDEGRGYMAEFEFSKALNDTVFAMSARFVEEEFDFSDNRSLLFLQFHVTRTF